MVQTCVQTLTVFQELTLCDTVWGWTGFPLHHCLGLNATAIETMNPDHGQSLAFSGKPDREKMFSFVFHVFWVKMS